MTPDYKRRLTEDALLIDDDFARTLGKSVGEHVRILVITDCCHSGTIADIDSYDYRQEIIGLSAARDDEKAEEAEAGGGKFTRAMLQAVEELDRTQLKQEYSVR